MPPACQKKKLQTNARENLILDVLFFCFLFFFYSISYLSPYSLPSYLSTSQTHSGIMVLNKPFLAKSHYVHDSWMSTSKTLSVFLQWKLQD